jgi:hypothetical protein
VFLGFARLGGECREAEHVALNHGSNDNDMEKGRVVYPALLFDRRQKARVSAAFLFDCGQMSFSAPVGVCTPTSLQGPNHFERCQRIRKGCYLFLRNPGAMPD